LNELLYAESKFDGVEVGRAAAICVHYESPGIWAPSCQVLIRAEVWGKEKRGGSYIAGKYQNNPDIPFFLRSDISDPGNKKYLSPFPWMHPTFKKTNSSR
jgi:hypothetical protein